MYTHLLNTAIEIEGLIRILRDGDAAPEAVSLLKDKSAALAAEVAAMEIPVSMPCAHDMADASDKSDSSDKSDKSDSSDMSDKSDISDESYFDDDIILSFEEDDAPAAPSAQVSESLSSPEYSAPAKEAPSLKSLFSLNDRFLFSRELFGGDMKLFDSTLKFIDGIKDFADIEDYFYSELEWNPEDPNVAAYLDIIRPHFPD